MTDLKLDEESYREGRAAFAAGASIRDIVEQVQGEPDDVKAMSGAIGFADALLDLLRSLKGGASLDPAAGQIFNQS